MTKRTDLQIADGLALPLEAVTSTFAILAVRGSGKTYAASVLAEEMLKQGQQIVALDPTGAWHGLRSSADGKRPGFEVAVFGGDHGDLPLEEGAGEVIATALVEHRFSAAIDLSLFRKAAAARFMVAFAETLYRLNRNPIHLFVDEADAFAPQRTIRGGDEPRLLGAMEDIVRRGRKRGIGCTLITQRPAVLNKNVLTQCESLLALRVVHPRDIAAVHEWIAVHATDEDAKDVLASLPTLAIGEAWFWSPGWLRTLKRIRIRARETFDSGATPRPGRAAPAPKVLAQVDLTALGAQIAASVEKAKENDPKELRRRLAELQKRLASVPEARVERVEVPVLKNGQLERLEKTVEQIVAQSAALGELGRELAGVVKAATAPQPIPGLVVARHPITPIKQAPRAMITERHTDLTGPEQRILDAVEWLTATNRQPDQDQGAVAFLAGYTVGGGAFNNPKGRLRGRGLIEYRGDRLALTDLGHSLASAPVAALTSAEMQARVLERLPGPEQRLLRVLIDAYPAELDNDELARRAGYEPNGGAFNNPRGRLRSLGLVHYPSRGKVVASAMLFVE